MIEMTLACKKKKKKDCRRYQGLKEGAGKGA